MCFAIGDIEKYYIYPRARYRGCARCPLFPDLLCGLATGRSPSGGGRVLPVGDASVGEAAVRRTSASVRSRRARGRWRLRQRVAPVAARQKAHRDEMSSESAAVACVRFTRHPEAR